MQHTRVDVQGESRRIASAEIIGFSAACGLCLHMGFGTPAVWCVFVAVAVGVGLYGWFVFLPSFAFKHAVQAGNLLSQIDDRSGRRIFHMCPATRGKRFVLRHIRMNGLSSADRGLDDVL